MNYISYSLKSLEQALNLMYELECKGFDYYLIYGRHKLFTVVWVLNIGTVGQNKGNLNAD
jgi:hypothetical protein